MFRALSAVALASLMGCAHGESKSLTQTNFDAEVFKPGRFTIVKFQAPWCGHCKKLKPDWDRLGAHFNKADSMALVADVDCTADEGKDLCSKYGVEGYPTIKYFGKDASDLGEKYEESREYNSLKKFVRSMSKPPCDVSTLTNCNKKEKAFIEETKGWDAAKKAEEQQSIESQLAAAKAKHQEEADLFEKQKEEAMATMKRQEEAKTALDALSKKMKYKINILAQEPDAKQEL